MKWFGRSNEIVYKDEESELEFKKFHNTYKLITFAMILGLVYPNEKRDTCRIVSVFVILSSVLPIAFLVFIDIYKCWMKRDYIEIIRHSTILGPFLGSFLKMFLMYDKRVECQELMAEINKDYIMYNTMAEKYKVIARASVKYNLNYTEKCWALTTFTCVMVFPAAAIVLNLYSHLFEPIPTRHMVHAFSKPFTDPEEEFPSPYFEILFIYSCYCAVFCVVNFLGYDGFYGVAINHACLKMELYCKSLEDAMTQTDLSVVYSRVIGVIKEQSKMFRFVDLIQETFHIWLGIILMATLIQMCTVMYRISEGHGFDLRNATFIVGTIIHIFLPCYYASKLKSMGIMTSDLIYSSGWENVHDETIRKMLMFMIARAQKPVDITALNMFTFNMELFVSMLQTSYSMFTLLRSSE